jgi:restriction endonuclease
LTWTCIKVRHYLGIALSAIISRGKAFVNVPTVLDGGMVKSPRKRQITNLRTAVVMRVMKKRSLLGLVSNATRSRQKALADALPAADGGMAKFPRNNSTNLMRAGMRVMKTRSLLGLVSNATRSRLKVITDALAVIDGGMAKSPRGRRRLSTNLIKVRMRVKRKKSLHGLVANAVTSMLKIQTNVNGAVKRRG